MNYSVHFSYVSLQVLIITNPISGCPWNTILVVLGLIALRPLLSFCQTYINTFKINAGLHGKIVCREQCA